MGIRDFAVSENYIEKIRGNMIISSMLMLPFYQIMVIMMMREFWRHLFKIQNYLPICLIGFSKVYG